jgi:hypothetical protein
VHCFFFPSALHLSRLANDKVEKACVRARFAEPDSAGSSRRTYSAQMLAHPLSLTRNEPSKKKTWQIGNLITLKLSGILLCRLFA